MGVGRPEDQPLPVPNEHPYAQKLIHDDLEAGRNDVSGHVITELQASLEKRRALGEKRYKVPGLQPFNGRDVVQDAFEEVLDAITYMKAVCLESGEEADQTCYINLLVEALYLQGRIMQRDAGDVIS